MFYGTNRAEIRQSLTNTDGPQNFNSIGSLEQELEAKK